MNYISRCDIVSYIMQNNSNRFEVQHIKHDFRKLEIWDCVCCVFSKIYIYIKKGVRRHKYCAMYFEEECVLGN